MCSYEQNQQMPWINLTWRAYKCNNTSLLLHVVQQSLVVVQKGGKASTFRSPSSDPLLPFVFVSSVIALCNWTPVQTGGHNCRGYRATEGARGALGASSHRDCWENKTETVKCWWEWQTKVEKWYIHQWGVRTTGHGEKADFCGWEVFNILV